MTGVFYGIGVGPGDPELMTQKALKAIRASDVIAAPGENVRETTAYRIAVRAAPGLERKELLPILMPMVMDRSVMERAHRRGAEQIERVLLQGKSVGFLTLGDSTIYSTFSYLEKIVKKSGFQTVYINGVPSFCAAAAVLGIPLAEWREPLHIIPAMHRLKEELSYDGTCVLMKSGSHMKEVKELLKRSGKQVCMVENCGMASQKRYTGAEQIPDDAGYFSLMIAKENNEANPKELQDD
ncbi:precorrin-2 C(20)-methyltransferase [Lachnospiraceae bacterium]|nr:precorrin-2 C(20)-methyltransferase [Lachnospiraceae bacterium]